MMMKAKFPRLITFKYMTSPALIIDRRRWSYKEQKNRVIIFTIKFLFNFLYFLHYSYQYYFAFVIIILKLAYSFAT